MTDASGTQLGSYVIRDNKVIIALGVGELHRSRVFLHPAFVADVVFGGHGGGGGGTQLPNHPAA